MSRPISSARPASPPGSPTFRRAVAPGSPTVPADQRARILAEQQRRNSQAPGTFSITNAGAAPVSPLGGRTAVRRPSAPGVQMTGSPRATAASPVRPGSPTNARKTLTLPATTTAATTPVTAAIAVPVVAAAVSATATAAVATKSHDDCHEEQKCEEKKCEPVECHTSCDHGDGDVNKCECPMDDCHCDSESSCSDEDSKSERSCSSKERRQCKSKTAKAKANGLDPLVVALPQEIAFPTDQQKAKDYKATVVARIKSRLDIHPGTAKLLSESDLGTLVDSVLVAFPTFSILTAHELAVHVGQLVNSVPALTNTPIARHTVGVLLLQSIAEQLYAIALGKVPPSVAVIVAHQLPKMYIGLEPLIRSGVLTLSGLRKADLDYQSLINKVKTEVAAQKKARVAAKAKAKSVKAAGKSKAKGGAKKAGTKDTVTSNNSFCCGKVEDN